MIKMKRNLQSNRSKKWIERNSLNNPECERYVRKLCDSYFELPIYKIGEYDSDEKALWITYGCFSYIIEVDRKNVNLKVFESKNHSKGNNYHVLKKTFVGDTCWYESLSWVKNKY